MPTPGDKPIKRMNDVLDHVVKLLKKGFMSDIALASTMKRFPGRFFRYRAHCSRPVSPIKLTAALHEGGGPVRIQSGALLPEKRAKTRVQALPDTNFLLNVPQILAARDSCQGKGAVAKKDRRGIVPIRKPGLQKTRKEVGCKGGFKNGSSASDIKRRSSLSLKHATSKGVFPHRNFFASEMED